MDSIALTLALHQRLMAHLLRDDHQEDLCFGLWYPSRGRDRTTALVSDVILPGPGDRNVHGNVSFNPKYFERAVGIAAAANAGLAFFHSHPAHGWQDMSNDDVIAEQSRAPATSAATGLPLIGMTIGTDGSWSGRGWHRTGERQYERRWCSSVRVVGEALDVTYNDALIPPPQATEELLRTISSWGPAKQADLARLTVGVIGGGSVGSIIAEALARMGVMRIRLIDFDFIKPHNRDRLLHAGPEAAKELLPKVHNLADAIRKSATASPFSVEPLMYSVTEELGYRAALDCDVLFSCVDRPWPRHVLNFIAYAHLIPVVDGGISVETTRGNTGLKRADWRSHIAAPTRRCMECLEQYNVGFVATERAGHLDDPNYIRGLPLDHPLRRNENVFTFSTATASQELLQFLSMVVAPLGCSNAGAQTYHFVTGMLDTEHKSCEASCVFPSLIAKGDRTGLTLTGPHPVAEAARADWARRMPRSTKPPLWKRLWNALFA